MERTTLQGTISGVEQKNLTRNSDGRPFTVWDITLAEGTRISCSQQMLAQQAYKMIGQQAYFDVSVKPNGVYTNYYLNAIKADHEPQPGAVTYEGGRWPGQTTTGSATTGYVQPMTTTVAPAAVTVSQPAPVSAAYPTEKDKTIWRQTATKVAAHMSSTPAEFWDNVEQMMLFYELGVAPSLAAPVGHSVTALADTGNGDIPF